LKKIIICRHAKSSWSTIGQQDFERPLNDRGNIDAPNMGKRLLQKNILPELIISSTAQRAKETTWHLCKALNLDIRDILWYDELYHASEATIDDIVATTADKYNHIMVVCHNPGITYWVNQQAGILTDNVPTCGMFAFEADTKTWTNYKAAIKNINWYDYPKSIK
jgi:phosphohistidine phosphatase